MGLFFDVLSSINNPNQQGSVEQLSAVTTSLQQLANSQGISPNQMGSVLTALGGALSPALKQQKGMLGGSQLEGLVGQLLGAGAGVGTGAVALQTLLPPQVQKQIAQAVAQKTGLNATVIQGLLPQLLPAVLGLLGMGAPQPGSTGGNSLLTAFLDSDRSGSTDLGDVVKFAGRFLNPA